MKIEIYYNDEMLENRSDYAIVKAEITETMFKQLKAGIGCGQFIEVAPFDERNPKPRFLAVDRIIEFEVLDE